MKKSDGEYIGINIMKNNPLLNRSVSLLRCLVATLVSLIANTALAADSTGVEKEFINSTTGYTHVVTLVTGDVKMLYVSGQVGNREGEVPESFADQIEAVFANMEDQLEAAGATMADVIKLNGFIVDINRDKVNAYSQARSRYFSADTPPPASTLVGVAGLVRDYYLVEVEAVAVIPAS